MPSNLEIFPTVLSVVACLLVDRKGEILVQRRPAGKPMAGLWEFPGGKIEGDEGPETALVRELKEELGIEIRSDALHPLTFASAPLGDRRLLLLLYACHQWANVPVALHASEIAWVTPDALFDLDMPPADKPLLPAIKCYVDGLQSLSRPN